MHVSVHVSGNSVCVCVRARACVCMCVSEREREREREREADRQTDGRTETKREASTHMCVAYMCIYAHTLVCGCEYSCVCTRV